MSIVTTLPPPQPLSTFWRFMDLTGKRFHRLVVKWYIGKTGTRHKWICECDCGNHTIAASGDLRSEHTQSCGCYNKDRRAETNITHGHSFANNRTPEYRAYSLAKGRCNNPKTPNFHLYGGRGIEFRFTSFEEFLQELGFRPSAKYSVDRIDNDGHYEKGNVRWATKSEQGKNKRTCVHITINGFTETITYWRRQPNSRDYTTIRVRLAKGWCEQCSVFGHRSLRKCIH